ncbi:sodium-dependent bicarbonate transport family permease [Salegentibacter sp. HM20]
MNINLLLDNLTSPVLLFFVMGILAVQLKSDLEIPKSLSKLISLYLLFSIGFNGGRELAHNTFSMEIIWTILFGVSSALVVPIYTFFLLKKKLSIENSGVIAAAYGSITAVTFVTAASFLEIQQISYSGHMVAFMALMEAPAIIVGVILISLYGKKDNNSPKLRNLIGHSFTNGSVLMILGSLVIGLLASESQALGIAPFTTDILKGFLAIFLLDMGIVSGRKLADFIRNYNGTSCNFPI